MAILPANVARVPNLLNSQLATSAIGRTNVRLLEVQTQLGTGKLINRMSDDPIRAAAIANLDRRLETASQRTTNLATADSVLGFLDNELNSVTELVRDARGIALQEVNITSDATSRRQVAATIDEMLRSLAATANRQGPNGLYVFGGSQPTTQPLEQTALGYRYRARGAGLITDLGPGNRIPITIGGDNAIGETSARLRSTLDLNPSLTPNTRIADLRGGRGLGVSTGTFSFSFNGGPSATVSIGDAQTVQDALDQIEIAIRQYETDNSVTILGPGGLSATSSGISIDVVAGGSLAFTDINAGSAAADLGLTAAAFTPTTTTGADLDPQLTMNTPLSAIPGLTLPLGSIRLRMSTGATSTIRDVNLGPAQTIGDLRSLIESTDIGVRLQISENGRSLAVLNEVAGPRLSIEEVAGGANTASLLGIRSMDQSTPLADFNDGRGVRVNTGGVDPITGLPDPALDVDFRVTLGNGQAFDVNLRPQDTATVQTLLARINSEFATAVANPPLVSTAPALTAGDFQAVLTDGTNGIAFTSPISGGSISVENRNNSAAAQDLGLLNATWDPGTGTLLAEDRAAIRVSNLFSDLIDLRDSLLRNDVNGISIAAESLQNSDQRVSAAHALVGSYAQQVTRAQGLLEDQRTLDTRVRSELQDLDFAEAATRLSLLQTQLQATMTTAGRFGAGGRTLLDFLG